VACLAVPHFSTLSYQWHDFRKKSYWNKTCVLTFSTIFVWNISHSKKNWTRCDHECTLVLPLFLSDFNETLIFSTDFRKILKHQISCQFVQWEPSCSMRTDRQTVTINLIVAFNNFAKAPKNIWRSSCNLEIRAWNWHLVGRDISMLVLRTFILLVTRNRRPSELVRWDQQQLHSLHVLNLVWPLTFRKYDTILRQLLMNNKNKECGDNE